MVPEVSALTAPCGLIRIPPELDIPLTARVRHLLDSRPLRRLARVSQLGLVSLVYPGATHSRLEHSLGVYRNALLVLNHLSGDARFQQLLGLRDAEAFVVAALLHDVGHWPFCHAIEDMRLAGVTRHEERARQLLLGPDILPLLERDWKCDVEQVLRLLEGTPENDTERLLCSMLSGPLDVDKLDYLVRDSLHAGVPYGRNFDSGRLINSLQVHPDNANLAISEKGRTAAEMMVFARYVMFSEVYWHHAVRSATAMLQRAIYLLQDRLDMKTMSDLEDSAWIAQLRRVASGKSAETLVEGLFGPERNLLKRVAQFNLLDDAERHKKLAHRPYEWLAGASQRLADHLAHRVSKPLGLADVVIDAPPVKLEVDINIDVISVGGSARPLGQASPVVEALANRQFDSHVKRVRVFVPREVRRLLPEQGLSLTDLDQIYR